MTFFATRNTRHSRHSAKQWQVEALLDLDPAERGLLLPHSGGDDFELVSCERLVSAAHPTETSVAMSHYLSLALRHRGLSLREDGFVTRFNEKHRFQVGGEGALLLHPVGSGVAGPQPRCGQH